MITIIIWINGTFGVGKTTVALKLNIKLEKQNVKILESDKYYELFSKQNPMKALFGGVLPQYNSYFLEFFKQIIKNELKDSKKILIIVMALTSDKCKTILYDYFIKYQNNTMIHIVLDAKKETIWKRIELDSKRDENQKDILLNNIGQNLNYLKKIMQMRYGLIQIKKMLILLLMK